jgi:hypothetical protein
MAEIPDSQRLLQLVSEEFQKLQGGIPGNYNLETPNSMLTCLPDLQSSVDARQKLESQLQENTGVQKVRIFSHGQFPGY